ncbi:DUF342 domain-containing protein [Candidatus Contubernalis alkaliaceticus]|uniref:DUF342 domain-containing protein n=1 Tax=Candidatus Contubernalis alkaliaceticus TaxID=338645 RepID=UPI001F4BEC96|nr:flagellar assembly protein A [Candidatus Contubernalis alkalaceticus]UNC91771.1 DUF342 domain-containing protein [Candidatus Contubernalis alkalaceticus]
MEGENGTIKIVDQKVIVSPPQGQGQHPQIMPADGLIILVNNQEINSPTPVTTEDEIIITDREEILENGKITVEISPDGLTAILHLKPVLKARFYARDSKEEFILKPAAERTIIKEPAADLDTVKSLLKENQIIYGIDEDVLRKAIFSMNAEGIIIAQGVPPINGKDAKIQFFFTENSAVTFDEESLNNIDYREKGDIFSVEKDFLLAEKIPAKEGTPGMSVTGKEIPFLPPKDFKFLAASNIYLDEDQLKVYAKDIGRPRVEKGPGYYKIKVLPLYIVQEDVALSSGHVRFRGDVQINGKVQESMEVLAGGSLQIYGGVNGANIRAGGSITIFKNVINSRIEAGAKQSFVLKVSPYLLEFEKALLNILKSYKQIITRPEFKKARFGFILDLLVEKKFTTFPKQLKELHEMLKIELKGDFPEEMVQSVKLLNKTIGDFNPLPYQELTKTVELLQITRALKELFQEQPQEKSSITIIYALNSILEASGSITVEGQGCYHTDIISQDTVEVKGVIRGGTITAKNDVRINKIGSDAAIETTVIIPENKTVYMNKVFENTIVQAGKSSYKFTSPKSRVKVFFDKISSTAKVDNF